MPKKKLLTQGSSATKVILVVGILLIAYLVFSWGGIFIDYLSGDYAEKKSDEQFDKIMEIIKPTAEHDYNFHAPTSQAKNRTIDCKKAAVYQGDFPINNPLCLNLYRTSAEEINKKISEGKYERIVLYGEYLIWDVTAKSPDPNWNLGQAAYDTALFNDQITIPKLMSLYGWKDLQFIQDLTPNKTFPFPALYYRVSSLEETQKACRPVKGEHKTMVGGCAVGVWSTIVLDTILGEKMSLANQKVWRISDQKDPDFLAFDYRWPNNCHTTDVMLHETAHVFLNAFQVFHPQHKVASRYFNEHQADVIKILGTNLVCGDGAVVNFRDNNKKQVSLLEFNASYPPAEMGSVSPKLSQTCQLAILNQWNRFMLKGNFETQFTAFMNAYKEKQKKGQSIEDDKIFANLLIELNRDAETKPTLQSHGCAL